MQPSAAQPAPRRSVLKAGALTLLLAALLILSGRFTARALPPAADAGGSRLSALTVMLSGSRGILSEILWWRIGELQRQNRYTETAVLTDWLLALEPASPEVRIFNAWNLAYNISVAHDSPEDRWFWVRRGIALLQEGIRLFPGDTASMRQLGWIFEDKIGGPLDTAAPYYRAHLADVVPAGAMPDFLKSLGLPPDMRPSAPLCALYWYTRAGDAFSVLRVLSGRLAAGPASLWAPPFLRAAQAVWDDLAPQQQRQILQLLHALREETRGTPAVQRFLEEHPL